MSGPAGSDAGVFYRDIVQGAVREHAYVITPAVYQRFLEAFEDRSPIHVDSAFAMARGFAGPVMHGAILNGFVSHFVCMVFPGPASLLLSADLRFSQPCYLGDVLNLEAKVAQKVDAHQVIVLHVSFFNRTRQYVATTGRLQVQVRDS